MTSELKNRKNNLIDDLAEGKAEMHLVDSGVALTDENGTIKVVNPPWLIMHALDADDVIGAKIFSFYDPSETELLQKIIVRTFAGEKGELTIDYQRPDGQKTVIIMHFKAMHINGNKNKQVMMTVSELTAEQKTERLVRKESIRSRVSKLARASQKNINKNQEE